MRSLAAPAVPMDAVPEPPRTENFQTSNIAKEQRIYFPETWLWQLETLDETGVNKQNLTLPDTVTEWVGKTVCVHQEKGVGISSKAPITTFTPFFAELTLPPSVKRGEILPVKISVFNYLKQSLPVKIVLHSSPEYEILPLEGEGLPLNEESHAFGERSACVTAQDKVTHTVRIRPTEIGDVNITVSAFVDDSYVGECGPTDISKRDALVKPILVEAEGFPQEKTWTKYICTKDLENNVDALDIWQVELPSNIVEGSARGWVTIVGDLLGPTIDNLGSLIRKPYGCGEQNMLNFAPNIYIMQYLDATRQTTKDIADRAIGFMKTGYQRELKYRHLDGSFSAFGKSDNSGSTWLTAFVVKSFAQAQQYISIDQDDLRKSMSWLRRQQRENGCFQSVGKVLHKGMKGGIAETSAEAPLTAYVLLALLEAGQNEREDVVKTGIECLLRDEDPSSYTLALISYALALAGHSQTETYIQQLLGKSAKSSSSIFWESVAGPGKSDAVAVETAGYAVLAMITHDAARYDDETIKIVKWISSKRNGQGGFVSTQDTVVALQALAAFSKTLSQGGTDVVVTVESQNLEHAFFVKESNKLLQQMVMLPSLPTSVVVDMAGDGCVLMQAVLRYNVPIPSPVKAFSLSVDTKTVGDDACVTKEIKICSAYLLPDEKSNMAVIEINLVSGYIPDKQDLKQLIGYGTGLFKRYEVDGSKINIYIDEFSKELLCLDFKILREVDVENAKPGTVMVYDYYQPEFSISEKYTLPPNDECLPWVNPIIEHIEVLPALPAQNVTTTAKPEDIKGLVDALDEYFDYEN
ncbi:alpha-1-inhibitor 3-like isoform X2 [Oratosquilla oratoria]|uniref:alpha-1-inhibitor 3-like isoform X2 n=1 Tax=Oratosquilla oratoria TaxID=337810 RepID=UPI003F7599F4